ncbi:MAG: dTMP kinase [Candidatus Algichlamydia australiensis]|nr:dTMP kinase [Chlamydiales bacterium]
MKLPGLFITFEGGEGAGKSTLIEHLAEKLRTDGHEIIQTREPGGCSLSNRIRDLLNHKESFISAKTELLLFLASRAQHVEEVIEPALRAGKMVLCDRFNDSTLAYQGVARSIDLKLVKELCDFVSLHIEPDLTLFLDIDPEEGLRRIKSRQDDHTPLENLDNEGLDFHTDVRKAYLSMIQENPKRMRRVDASLTPSEVCRLAYKEITSYVANTRA